MVVVSRDEIRLDAGHVKVIYVLADEWGRRLVDSVVLNRPLKEWKRPDGPAKSHGAYVEQSEAI